MSEEKKRAYSWSKLNNFYTASKGDGCHYCFYRQYVEGDRGEGNYFTEYGLLLHETIEKLHKNQIFAWDIEDELNKGLNEFQYYPPFKKMGDSYKTALFEFFDPDTFEQLFNDYEILESEESVEFYVDDILLKGFPDLIANHKQHGFVIADYKSSKKYEGSKLQDNIRQLYLYSIPIYEKYGRYPDNLVYIYPREKGQKEFVYPFDMDKLAETKQWVRDTVAAIEKHEDYEPRCNNVDVTRDFYSTHLCNMRNNCTYRTVNKS